MKKEFGKILGKKWYIRLPVVLIFALVILAIVGFANSFIASVMPGAWAIAIGLIIAAVLLIASMGYHSGSESFIQGLPIVLLLFAVSALLVPFLPFLNYSMGLSEVSVRGVMVGLAITMGSFYLADGVYQKYIHTRIN
jgi:hypothetical protein